jgi:hypothetical protein
LAGRVQRQDRIIVTLPASEITDGVAENLHLALRRYCESRLTLVQRETQVAWRQGIAHLAEDGRSPLSNPLQSRISAGVHRVPATLGGRFRLYSLISLAAVATLAWPQVTLSPWPRHT